MKLITAQKECKPINQSHGKVDQSRKMLGLKNISSLYRIVLPVSKRSLGYAKD